VAEKVGYRRAKRAMKMLQFEFERLRGDLRREVEATIKGEEYWDAINDVLESYVDRMARPVCYYLGWRPDGAECYEFKRKLRDYIVVWVDVDVELGLNPDMLRDILNEAVREARGSEGDVM